MVNNNSSSPTAKRQRIAYNVVNASVRKNGTNFNGVKYHVVDTHIPRILINRLKNIWSLSDSKSKRIELSGSFKFGIRVDNKGCANGVYYGMNKNNIVGERGGVGVIPNTISYHTHPGPGPNAINGNRLFTMPSGQDLALYLWNWPKNQINLILDQGGIMVLDVDVQRVKTVASNKKIRLDLYAQWVSDDFETWYRAYNNKNTSYVDGFLYLKFKNSTQIDKITRKIHSYGINCTMHSWDSQKIPISLENIVDPDQVNKSYKTFAWTGPQVPRARRHRKIPTRLNNKDLFFVKNKNEPAGIAELLLKYKDKNKTITDRSLVKPADGKTTTYTPFRKHRMEYVTKVINSNASKSNFINTYGVAVLKGIPVEKLRKLYSGLTGRKNALLSLIKKAYAEEGQNQYAAVYNVAYTKARPIGTAPTINAIRKNAVVKSPSNGGLTNAEIEMIQNYIIRNLAKKTPPKTAKILPFKVSNSYVNRKIRSLK